jgi:hypothetical protein
MTSTLLSPYPADDPATSPAAGSAEAMFIDYLVNVLGYDLAYEPRSFPIWMTLSERSRHGRKSTPRLKAFTPDLLILGRYGSAFSDPVYLELTTADLYLKPRQLPAAVLAKNHRLSASGKQYVSPAEYLRLKRTKITAAIKVHPELVLALLTAVDQAFYLTYPEQLISLISGMVDTRISCLA